MAIAAVTFGNCRGGTRRKAMDGTDALVKVVNGKVTYLQFLEDSYATAASFRKDGSWTVQTEPGTEPFSV